jgi:hypothetical protein
MNKQHNKKNYLGLLLLLPPMKEKKVKEEEENGKISHCLFKAHLLLNFYFFLCACFLHNREDLRNYSLSLVSIGIGNIRTHNERV